MTTQTQDTHPQDPIDRFALYIEGLRRMPVPRGLARIVHLLLVEFFTFLWAWAAEIAEQRRNGTLPEVVPAAAREPRAWPAELRPRESGWVEQRSPEAAGGDPGCSMVVAVADMGSRPRGNDGVERGNDGVARGNDESERLVRLEFERRAAVASPRQVNRGWGIFHRADVVFSGFDSRKWGLAGLDTCVYFITI